jgi:DNA helicase-2/ATP-dependent DNA helicase PcrA
LTTYLTRQVQVAAGKFGLQSVLVASLTRAAAEEVVGRDTGIDKRQIGTLHSHAYRALQRPSIAESREGMTAWNEWVGSRSPSLKVGDRYTLDPENAPAEGIPAATDGERMLQEIGVLRARMTPVELWRQAPRRFYEIWCQFKAETGHVDFTDLIERAIEEVEEAPGSPTVMFLDEAQDMSRLEMTLARKWGARCQQLVVVGDPFQNLYEWRGSEPEAFDVVEAASERVLEQSYRVPRAVHAYAVEWARPLVPEGGTFPEYKPRDEEGETRQSLARWNDPDTMIRLITEDLERFEDDPGHPTVMVLATCGYMLDPLIRALRDEGTPFANPYRPTHGGWNPMRSANRLLRFLHPDPETYGDDARMWTWGDLDQWVEPLKAQGLMTRGAKREIASHVVRERFVHPEDLPENVPVKPEEVMRLFVAEAQDGVFDVDPEWWLSSLLASRERQFHFAANVMRKQGRAALRERPRVCVGTIHSVKGGQADSVYVFPDLSRQGYWTGWHHLNGRAATIRQFYVAFTRARHTLTVCEQSGQEYVPLPRPSTVASPMPRA